MFKKTFKLLCFCIFLLAIIFVAERLYSSLQSLRNWHFHSDLYVYCIFMAVIYALNYHILSSNWQRFLKALERNSINKYFCHYVYALNVLTKYIPGSIFQYAGRQAMGKQANLKQINIGFASLLEIISLVISASILSVLSIITINTNMNTYAWWILGIIILGCVTCYFLIINLNNIQFIKKYLPQDLSFAQIKIVFLNTLLKYIFYFLINGMLLALLCFAVAPQFSMKLVPLIISIWTLSWLAGYVVIGAPAGLGVREAVLIAALSHLLSGAAALIITLTFRIILTSGDVLFSLSWIMYKRFRKSKFIVASNKTEILSEI